MAEHFLYLTTTGRTSGLPRQIEIWFVVVEGRYYLVSQDRLEANWVKNLLRQPAVHFSVGPRGDEEAEIPSTAARARVVSHDDERDLVASVIALMDEKYGWSDGHVVELAPGGRRS